MVCVCAPPAGGGLGPCGPGGDLQPGAGGAAGDARGDCGRPRHPLCHGLLQRGGPPARDLPGAAACVGGHRMGTTAWGALGLLGLWEAVRGAAAGATAAPAPLPRAVSECSAWSFHQVPPARPAHRPRRAVCAPHGCAHRQALRHVPAERCAHHEGELGPGPLACLLACWLAGWLAGWLPCLLACVLACVCSL